jgi:translation initiation factor IF-2
LAEKIRIHNLAKELKVDSKAILQKCRAEDLDVKNHMSTLSAGLAATIREWFSEGSHTTAVETTDRVDLVKVRKAAKRKKRVPKKEISEDVAAESDAAPEAPDDKEDESSPIVQPNPSLVVGEGIVLPGTATQELSTATETESVEMDQGALVMEFGVDGADPSMGLGALDAAASVGVGEAEAVNATEVAEKGPLDADSGVLDREERAEEPQKPVTPAGPANVPAPAKLQGPKVVRVERPDVVTPPPRRAAPRGQVGDTIPGPVESDSDSSVKRPLRGRGRGKVGEAEEKGARGRSPRRTRGGLTEAKERYNEWRDRDLQERDERIKAASGRGIHARRASERRTGGLIGRKGKIELTEPVMLNDLSAGSGIPINQLIKKLMYEHKMQATKNMVLDADTIGLLAMDYDLEFDIVKPKSLQDKLKEEFDTRERKKLEPRPPVVAFLGHVDHGKTTLLDAIRKTRVVEGESGGITQHIGAYRIDRDGMSVSFLDTPGHEAFTAMRARGANLTDVVVLVVAVDDGVMPQTLEAINHAKASGVSVVVALNKVDLPGADIDRVFGQLSEHELTPQDWGGETDVIRTSAVKGEGVEELISHLSTLTELLDLKADPTVPACGSVIDAEMKERVGVVARVLVREGTLKPGDFVQCGPAYGRVRSMTDDLGRRMETAGPATPVELTGLNTVPGAGDTFYQVSNLQRAKQIAHEVANLRRAESLTQVSKPKTLEDLLAQKETGDLPELNVILRADVRGSIDALNKQLEGLPRDQVKLNILHSGVGGITESDVVLAEASSAIIIGFHVVPESGVQRLADTKGVDIRLYRVIYNVVDDIKQALEGKLSPDESIKVRGSAEVREVFRISKVGVVAGCQVKDGTIARNNKVRILRDSVLIREGSDLGSLRRFKDDAKEVRTGMECGIRVAGFDDVKPGDIIEAYEVILTKRTL